jgi:uncharacterized protein YndB with AHSA1/START domain
MTDDTTLDMARTIDAPRPLVYQAWTEPAHLDIWQGAPEGMTVTYYEGDLRPGGAYKLCMRGPDGVEHWLQGVYREVVEPERLVFTHAWLDERGRPLPATVVALTFDDRGQQTELTLHQTGFTSTASRDGHAAGWGSTFDRLAAYVASQRVGR